MKLQVLITGAAGRVGKALTAGLKGRHSLVLLDRRPGDAESIFQADLSRFDPGWSRHFAGMDAAVHLAANPDERSEWPELIPDNIEGLLNVCHACAEHSVGRLVFASSCHTMCGYKGSGLRRITADTEPLPGCAYGLSKLIGERICSSFQQRFGLSVVCLRIGWVPKAGLPEQVKDPWQRCLWLSDRDLVRIVDRAIRAEAVGFEVVYAVSGNRGAVWDLSRARAVLGYEPRDGLGREGE